MGNERPANAIAKGIFFPFNRYGLLTLFEGCICISSCYPKIPLAMLASSWG